MWKDAAASAKVDSLECEATSAYDFFTQVHQQSTNEEQPVPVKDAEVDTDNILREGEENMNKPLTADYLGLKDEDWYSITTVRPQIQFKKSDLIAQEKEIYFYPSNKPVLLQEKLGSNCEPHYLEDEGLYVGFRPVIPQSTKLHVEQRLIAAGQNYWFGIDGNVNTISDPFTRMIYNPIILEENGPSIEVEYKMPMPILPPNKSLLEHPQSKYLLEMKLLSIKFTHHPLFSREHVLAQNLLELHHQFVARIANMKEDRLAGHLEALRRARDNAVSGKNIDINHLERYADEIEATRLHLMAEGKSGRNLLISILTTWKNIKQLREMQGYSSTPLKLHIQKQLTNLEDERRKWDDMVKRECEEALRAHQIKYNAKLSEWKKQHKKLNYTERNGNRANDFPEGAEDIEMNPPAPVDLAAVKSEVLECLKESFRPPGEPQLLFDISTNNPIDLDPPYEREKQRRSAVSRSRIFVKIFYNEKEVCQSRSMPLGSRFEVCFNQLFTICVQQMPKSLKAEIHEEINSLSRHVVAEVYIPIPDSAAVLEKSIITQHEFGNSEILTFSHTGVGSGTHNPPFSGTLNKSNISACLYTSGVMECQVGWGVDESSGEVLGPNLRSYNDELLELPSDLNGMNISSDISKLQKWVKKSHLDPNDPTNSALFYFLKNADNWESKENNCFRLNPLDANLDFCSMEELDSNPRYRLLRLRDKGEPEFRGLQFIPLFEKEITSGIFREYEKRIAEPQDPSSCVSLLPPDLLESHRAWGQRFLLNVRQRILKQCHTAQQNRQLHEIVAEEQVPDIGTLGLTFKKWLQPKRPLHPKRKERKCITVQNLAGQEVKIIVNVVRAFDVPVRKDIDTLNNSIGSQGFKFNIVPVRPFVQICFQNVIARTTTAEGANPTWNQELHLPLQPPSGYSAGSLQSIKDTIHLNLFDEIVVDLLDDDRKRETNIHQRLERNWLGSLRIPFLTLYFNSRIEGIFKLYSPSILLGYEREPQQLQLNNILKSEVQQTTCQHNATFITLFITVQPALHPPEPFKEKLETNELPHLQDHLEKWEIQLLHLFPHRKVKTLVIDVSGKSVCVTRFFRSLAPPVMVHDKRSSEEQAARFVSMIPVITGNTLFPGLFDVWLTSDQVLQLLSGDCEDHAILLCCYFQHLGKKVWLLLGTGIPHGQTAYVLTREKSDYFVWDPVSGQQYSIFDTFCPVQKVYCLINEENIWANIQQDEAPRSTRFDVSRKSDWLPAFGRYVSAPADSIQPISLVYNETSNTAVQLLQDKIEKQLRESLMHWRKTARTIWNRYCISILRKLLPEMEYASWSTKESDLIGHIQELEHILGSHKICGFPINMPYTNIEAITECVKATGVHYNESEEVEFALAVYIHPYPNDVLSVWIYVASLIQRR